MARWISQNSAIARHPLVREAARIAGAELAAGNSPLSADRDCFIGWGYKTSGLWARTAAEQTGASYRLFEDGFVRSLKPGYGNGALYSLVEDGTGIYYDGTGASDLVRRLNDESFGQGDWQAEAESDLARFREIGASKYNWFIDEFTPDVLDHDLPEPGVLVVDQTAGDASIRHGGLSESDFDVMIEAALDENPGKPIYLRGHPDHLFRSRKTCLRSPLQGGPRVRTISAGLAPWQVFQRIERVYVGTSLLGMEALIHQIPVVTFGCPFYAGWGLTEDRNETLPGRTKPRSLPDLFHAAYRDYSRYFDPDTGKPCPLSRILDHLALQKECFRENSHPAVAFAMSPWKRTLMKRYLASPQPRLQQTRSLKKAWQWLDDSPDSRVIAWGRRTENPARESTDLTRVEDGFLRSAGLGAEFHLPLSLVFDRTGIYYDATAPSDLESILENHEFSPEEIRDAEELIAFILSRSLTKYNLEDEHQPAPAWPDADGRARLLVPGQVERDASIEWGSPILKTNLDLLREVRQKNPDAVIAYKPHPDVVKHLRPGRPLSEEIETLCDLVVSDLDIVPWLETCDEVHTMTSLSGFEALLRQKKVVCYGAPFYAGWGLTEDLVPLHRRTRNRTLVELAAATLIRYPRYLNPVTGEFTTALGAARLIAQGGKPLYSRPWFLRLIASGKTLLRRR